MAPFLQGIRDEDGCQKYPGSDHKHDDHDKGRPRETVENQKVVGRRRKLGRNARGLAIRAGASGLGLEHEKSKDCKDCQ